MLLPELRSRVRATLADPALTYRQRVQALATLAENTLDPPPVSPQCRAAQDKGVIHDMGEGNAPYRPRYVLPDYARALEHGSDHLELAPPADLDEALAFLLAMYSAVPSITGYPVYLGDLDALLEPFTDGHSDGELRGRLRLFWRLLDRQLPDAFVHANLGPAAGRVAHAILAVDRELRQVVPNLTLRVDPDITPAELLREAVRTACADGKPHFVNHPLMTAGLGCDYGVVSCYNSLRIGGGSHTLVRLNLAESVVQHPGGLDSFLETTLPRHVELTGELIAARVRYLVETSGFYEHDWLAREGLIGLDRFTAMFGLYGVAEAVDALAEREAAGRPAPRYGRDADASALARRLVECVADLVCAMPVPYCEGTGGHAVMHAQSGIASDIGATAGARVPVGREPALYEHIRVVAPLHGYFPAGVSDVFRFEPTVADNPDAVVAVLRGAFAEGMRDFTFDVEGNGFVRITGYLVREADAATVADGARHSSTFLGATALANQHLRERVPKTT
jgi:YjjI family glycine radical enzyme